MSRKVAQPSGLSGGPALAWKTTKKNNPLLAPPSPLPEPPPLVGMPLRHLAFFLSLYVSQIDCFLYFFFAVNFFFSWCFFFCCQCTRSLWASRHGMAMDPSREGRAERAGRQGGEGEGGAASVAGAWGRTEGGRRRAWLRRCRNGACLHHAWINAGNRRSTSRSCASSRQSSTGVRSPLCASTHAHGRAVPTSARSSWAARALLQ